MKCWPARAGKRFSALAAALAGCLFGHDIRVYSEFTRIDPYGQVVRADRGSTPREILSPAIARNAFSGFHVVVAGNPGDAFTLHVGQNPDNALRITVYKEIYTRSDREWIPDGLTRINLPYSGALGSEVPGQTAQAFWMDLWADTSAPVRRVKVEPEVFLDKRWIRYPMEVRVVQAAASGAASPGRLDLPAVTSPADASAQAAIRAALCGTMRSKVAGNAGTLSVRALIARDAKQDLAVAGEPDRILQASGLELLEWCSGYVRDKAGPEWFLRIRDRIYHSKEP